MKKLLTALFTVAIVIASAHSAFSFNSGKVNGVDTYDEFNPTVLPQLNLSVKQMTDINVLRETFLKDTRPLEHEMFIKRSELKRLWLQQNPDKEKIEIVREEIRVLRNQVKDNRNVYRLKVYNLLTQDQKEKLKSCVPPGNHGRQMRSRTKWHGEPGQRMRVNEGFKSH